MLHQGYDKKIQKQAFLIIGSILLLMIVLLVTGLFIGLFPSLDIKKDLKNTTTLQFDSLAKIRISEGEDNDENTCDSKFIFVNPAFSCCEIFKGSLISFQLVPETPYQSTANKDIL